MRSCETRSSMETFRIRSEARVLIEACRRHHNTVRPRGSGRLLGSQPPPPEAVIPSVHVRPD